MTLNRMMINCLLCDSSPLYHISNFALATVTELRGLLILISNRQAPLHCSMAWIVVLILVALER